MIRWIVDQALGTAPYARELRERAVVVDVRELVDRAGNDLRALGAKIDQGVSALESGSQVIVACDFGISRSNAIAAGILSKWKKQPLDWAVSEVVARTGESSIKLDVLSSVRRLLAGNVRQADPGSVLLTGGTGFLGRNLLRRLSDRMETFAPHREEISLNGATSNLEKYCRDRRIGQIVHLAHPRIFTNNEAMGESLAILKNLIDVCRVGGIRLVLPSGGVVFSGYRSPGQSVTPHTEAWPKGVYGETKYLQELLVKASVRNGDIEATIVRIAPTYGPGGDRPRFIRFFYQSLVDGSTIVTHLYNDQTPARLDLLYIDDAVSGIESVLGFPGSEVHHLAPGISFTPLEIAERIGALLGMQGTFTEMFVDDYASNVFLDSTATRESLQWEPTMQIDEGLSRTIAAFVDA